MCFLIFLHQALISRSSVMRCFGFFTSSSLLSLNTTNFGVRLPYCGYCPGLEIKTLESFLLILVLSHYVARSMRMFWYVNNTKN